MKKKVLVDLERLRYPNSGIASVFRNLAKGLLTLESNFVLDFFGPIDALGKYIPKSNIVNRHFWNKFADMFSSGYDLVHVSHQLSPYFKKNYSRTKKIVTLHDLNFLHENFTTTKKHKMLYKVNRSLKYADHIVCISNFVKDDFEKNKHLFGLKKLKSTEVIYNGITFPEKKECQINDFPILKDKKYLLNIGVLFPKKNQLTLIKMLKFLEEDLVLVVSGSKKDYEDQILEEIKANGLENRVHILRNISNKEKFGLLKNCEALCQPSVAEGFGIPPIEAMYFGRPVFLSTYTSLPEVGGDVAFYFQSFDPKEMANVILQGLEKYKTQPELEKQLTDWALQFDYKIMAKQYHDLYERILEN